MGGKKTILVNNFSGRNYGENIILHSNRQRSKMSMAQEREFIQYLIIVHDTPEQKKLNFTVLLNPS